jgi:hypothetical protein
MNGASASLLKLASYLDIIKAWDNQLIPHYGAIFVYAPSPVLMRRKSPQGPGRAWLSAMIRFPAGQAVLPGAGWRRRLLILFRIKFC